uniref:Uncharacterized protein LOC102808052 n=1 Tax=Saccoglossus kowalevskii TaxID=10224 RepID=A0ABM0M7E8_SACKO|nr:PREDICTED: uncharacterized protein LOC102808052 [Saccoglossus kowalevskii]
MFVYIKDYCNRIQCFPDVTLRDGCVPEFGVRKLEKEITKDLEGIEMLVEPAIWFKVLILDSVSIDCAKRKVLWTTCSQCRLTGQDRGWGFVYCAHVKELYHTSGECYDYDADLDDIFDLATCLLNDMPDMMSLLRLLHCYILPMITLNVEDLNVSKEALQQQIHSIHQLDHELNKKTGEMTKIKEFLLQKARELAAFLQGRDEIVHKSNREFLKALLSFLPTIEEEKRSELNSCQERVQNAKLEVSNCSEEATVQLDCARHDRDMTHHHLEEILSLRENINNLILFDIDEWYELKSSEEEFVHNTDRIEELKTEAMHIMDKKKRAISVREALNHAIQDLKLGKETTGVDISLLSGESATDVLKRGSWPTMWQSLSERITMLVNSKSHPIGRMHHDFCNHVNKYCRNAMEEDLISNNSSLDISTVLQLQQSNNWSTSSNHTENVNGRKTTLTDDDFVELDFPLMNPYKDKVNQITAEIKKHFTKVDITVDVSSSCYRTITAG